MAEKLKDGYKMPTVTTSKDELLQITVDWEKESGEYHDELKRIQDINELYYRGKQTKFDMIPVGQSNAVQNHIFMGIETVVPIMTANPPRFIAEPPEESDLAIRYANTVEKTLSIIYDEKDVRTKGEMLLRHMMIYRFGAWIPFFNTETNEVDVRWVRPQRIYLPKTSKLIYYYEKRDFTSDEMKAKFGEEEFKEFLKNKGTEIKPDDIGKVSDIYTVLDFHTKDVTFW